jgi:hypothetical protein
MTRGCDDDNDEEISEPEGDHGIRSVGVGR